MWFAGRTARRKCAKSCGIRARLCEGDRLRPSLSVVVDGAVSRRGLGHPLDEASEDFTLTATKTDKDGDSAQATLNIGQNLVFKDDGPSISTTGTEPTLTVDETVLGTNATASFAANGSAFTFRVCPVASTAIAAGWSPEAARLDAANRTSVAATGIQRERCDRNVGMVEIHSF